MTTNVATNSLQMDAINTLYIYIGHKSSHFVMQNVHSQKCDKIENKLAKVLNPYNNDMCTIKCTTKMTTRNW